MIHPLADVQSPYVGQNTKIWQFVVVLPRARIGRDCNICSHVFIENDVVIGDRVTIKNGVQLWDEDDVFVRLKSILPTTAPRYSTHVREGGGKIRADDRRRFRVKS